MRARHRVRQFWQALVAAPGPEAPPELEPGLAALYRGMPRADRAHGLRTRCQLPVGAPPDLLVAALLHDVGKAGAGIRLWHRVLFVLAARLAPRWLGALARDHRGDMWRGLAALQEHAAHGADLAAAAGGTPRAVALIRNHHAAPERLGWPEAECRLLEALQRAEEAS